MKSAAAPLAALLMIVIASGARAVDDAPQRLGVIEVSATPLPVRGLGIIPLMQVPASVQTLSAARIDSHAGVPLPSLLQRAFGGMSVSNGQNNPWQPDLSFRGFDASPLLGTPEALSVYVDGVRVNEPFGDVVNFDLIPMSAIAAMRRLTWICIGGRRRHGACSSPSTMCWTSATQLTANSARTCLPGLAGISIRPTHRPPNSARWRHRAHSVSDFATGSIEARRCGRPRAFVVAGWLNRSVLR